MKKMKTRFLMLLDALMMPTRGARSLALVCVVLTAATAWAAQSWTSGGCTVTLDNNGKMTVTKSTSGDGKMDIYQAEELVPWYDYTEPG